METDESLTDEKIVADALQTLRTIYGERIPEPTGFQLIADLEIGRD